LPNDELILLFEKKRRLVKMGWRA